MSKGQKEESSTAMIPPAQVMAERTESELFETSQFLFECDWNSSGGSLPFPDIPTSANQAIQSGGEESNDLPFDPRSRLSEQELLLEDVPDEYSRLHHQGDDGAPFVAYAAPPPRIGPAQRTRSHTSNLRMQATVTPHDSTSCSIASRPASVQLFTADSYTRADVILGRGGKSNHHPGNQEYLRDKSELQPRYFTVSKQEKTRIAQELVDRVHARGGRFMKEQDDGRWTEVDNEKARRKASQSLREESSKESRAEKRAKYKKRPATKK